MKMRTGAAVAAGVLFGALVLTGCSSESDGGREPAASETGDAHGDHGSHGGMDHPMDGGPVPEGMTETTDPSHPIGSVVTLTADHMAGMDGATATIVGAYDTYTYAVDVTPTTGGPTLENHKWVVQEEIRDAGADRLPDGTEVVLTADHMAGMDGAAATIVGSTDETVYVVDYEADGMTMTNHKWVVESEIEPAP